LIVLILLAWVVSAFVPQSSTSSETAVSVTPAQYPAQATTTPKATATPTANAATPGTKTFDPVLRKLESELGAEYPGATLTEAPAGTVGSVDLLRILATLPNGDVVMGSVTNGTVDAMTQRYQALSQPHAGLVSDAHTTHFGQSAAQAALGRLSTSADTSLKFTDTASTYNEYLLYTNTNVSSAILFEINVGPNPLT